MGEGSTRLAVGIGSFGLSEIARGVYKGFRSVKDTLMPDMDIAGALNGPASAASYGSGLERERARRRMRASGVRTTLTSPLGLPSLASTASKKLLGD